VDLMAGKFSVILSDCPWQYSDKATAGKRGADFKYDTISTRDLMHMRVGDLAAENSAHFMWVTGPFMLEGIRLMKSWGFRYVTISFNWIKLNKKNGKPFMGMGHYTRSNAEYVLLGTRGKLPVQSHSVHSVVMSPVREHSSKPPEVRERIVELFGDVPRLEIFARDRCAGWEATGLELDEVDIREYIEWHAPIKGGLAVFRSRTGAEEKS